MSSRDSYFILLHLSFRYIALDSIEIACLNRYKLVHRGMGGDASLSDAVIHPIDMTTIHA